MRSTWLLGVLVATSAAVAGSPTAATVPEPVPPHIVAVELSDSTSTVWLATSAGLFEASLDALADSDTFALDDAVWNAEPVAGADRPIDDIEPLLWPRGETLMAASGGVVWARGSDGAWSELKCNGDDCPGAITGLASTFDNNAPDEHDLIAFGPDGVWVLARDRAVAADDATPPTGDGWSWIELDSGVDVVAAAQDQRGRIWAMARVDDESSELRVYDNSWAPADPSRRTVVTRPLPSGWVVADR